MSILKKERVIYICGIALLVLTLIALCFPFIEVAAYTNTSQTNALPLLYIGWQILNLTNPYLESRGAGDKINQSISPIGSEALFVIFTAIMLILAVILAVICAVGLYRNVANGSSVGKKYINLLFIGFAILAVIFLLAYIIFINHLNTYVEVAGKRQGDIDDWSNFCYYNVFNDEYNAGKALTDPLWLTPVKTKMMPYPFIITSVGLIGAFVSVIFTMKVQDNSIIFPYKKKQALSAFVGTLLCASVFFLPFIDFFFTTEHILSLTGSGVQNMFLNVENGVVTSYKNPGMENLTQHFASGVGWDMLLHSSGGIEGYFKFIFYIMFTVAGFGIIYNLAFILAAVGVIKFNFDKKYIKTSALVILILSVLLAVGSVAYCIGINTQLKIKYNLEADTYFFKVVFPKNEFPQTYFKAGTFLCIIPSAVGYIGTSILNVETIK